MVPCVIPLDPSGRALRNSIQQNDARADLEVRELAELLDGVDLLSRTGSALTHQSVAPTARWLARNEPEVWAEAETLVGSYDYINACLTDAVGVERNWALESGLFDLDLEEWAADLCELAGLDPALMPAIQRPTDVIGTVSAAASRRTGLQQGTPVVGGSADHVAATLAAGVVEPGQVLVKLGGAGDILLASRDAVVDPRLYLDYHLVPDRWLPNGCMAASGTFIEWFARELGAGSALADLDAEAAASPAGSRGVVALPYMLGEKTPIHDPAARGVFYGLHLGQGRGDIFRSVLESVAFGFRDHFEVFADLGCEVSTVRVGDGGAASSLFTGLIADIVGLPLEPVRSRSGSALGVAFVAAMGTGLVEDWAAIGRFVSVGPIREPDLSLAAVYDEGFATYRELYAALAPLMHGRRGPAAEEKA
jgi:xylulokinase